MPALEFCPCFFRLPRAVEAEDALCYCPRTTRSTGFFKRDGEFWMPDNTRKIAWIGVGRMGYPMAERLLKAGHGVAIWNRARAKAQPPAGKGGTSVARP